MFSYILSLIILTLIENFFRENKNFKSWKYDLVFTNFYENEADFLCNFFVTTLMLLMTKNENVEQNKMHT